MSKTSLILSVDETSIQTLPLLMQSLCEQTDQQFEVLVAEAGSALGAAALVQEWQPRCPFNIHYVFPPDWANTIAAARNRAAAEAYGDYLIFLDASYIVATDFIQQHRRLSEAGSFVVAPAITVKRELTDTLLADPEAAPWRWPRKKWLSQAMKRQCGPLSALLPLDVKTDSNWRKNQPKRCADIEDGHMALWQRDFRLVGGFDERFDDDAYSNRELALRLVRADVTRKDGDYRCSPFHLQTGHPTMEKAIRVNQNYSFLHETMLGNRIVARAMVEPAARRHA